MDIVDLTDNMFDFVGIPAIRCSYCLLLPASALVDIVGIPAIRCSYCLLLPLLTLWASQLFGAATAYYCPC